MCIRDRIPVGLPAGFENIDILIIGSGPEESKVREKAKLFSNVHFLGYQSKENTIKLIRGSDIIVQPSLMEGGTSSSILEAMACKTPVLLSRLPWLDHKFSYVNYAYIRKINAEALAKKTIDIILPIHILRQKQEQKS